MARNTSFGFEVDEHITRVLLTTTQFDTDIRAAGIIRYTDETADMVRETLRLVATYDHGDPGIFRPESPVWTGELPHVAAAACRSQYLTPARL